MLVDLVDTKQKGKFCRTFVFIICTISCSNFQLDNFLKKFYPCPLVTQHYPQASPNKLQKLFEGI